MRHPDLILQPVGWESASTPTLGDHPQRIVNRDVIERCQLLVAVFWSRLGTPTPDAASGTVAEIEHFIRVKGPGRVMLYFCTRPLQPDVDATEFVRLRQYKEQMASRGLYWEYQSVEEFEGALYQHLDGKVADFRAGRLPPPATVQWTPFRCIQSNNIPTIPTPFRVKLQVYLSSEDKTVPLMLRVAANAEGHLGQWPATARTMSVFPSAAHLASWATLCPGNNESAGKHKSGKTRKGNRWLRNALIEAAAGASRAKDSALQARFRRVLRRRGPKKAVVALAHALLRIAYHVLADGSPYRELGADYSDRRHTQRLTRRAIRLLEGQGYRVTLEPAA